MTSQRNPSPNPQNVGIRAQKLRKINPYWYPHISMAKERWWGREILEIVSTEFRDRSVEYYASFLLATLTPN